MNAAYRKKALNESIDTCNVVCFALILYSYFLDLSLIRALTRAITQRNFFVEHGRVHRAGIFLSLVLSGLCFFFHLVWPFSDIAEAGWDGYNHGGLYIDFIGQRSESKVRLLVLDIVIVIIHLFLIEFKALLDDVNHQASSTQTVENEEEGRLQTASMSQRGAIVCILGSQIIESVKNMANEAAAIQTSNELRRQTGVHDPAS